MRNTCEKSFFKKYFFIKINFLYIFNFFLHVMLKIIFLKIIKYFNLFSNIKKKTTHNPSKTFRNNTEKSQTSTSSQRCIQSYY